MELKAPELGEVYEIYRQKLLEATLLRMDIEMATGTSCDTYEDEEGNKRLLSVKNLVNEERKRYWQAKSDALPHSTVEIAQAIEAAGCQVSGGVHFQLVDKQIVLRIDDKDYTLAQIARLLRALPNVA